MCAYWTGPAVYNVSYIESKKLVVVVKTPLTPNILYSVKSGTSVLDCCLG